MFSRKNNEFTLLSGSRFPSAAVLARARVLHYFRVGAFSTVEELTSDSV